MAGVNGWWHATAGGAGLALLRFMTRFPVCFLHRPSRCLTVHTAGCCSAAHFTAAAAAAADACRVAYHSCFCVLPVLRNDLQPDTACRPPLPSAVFPVLNWTEFIEHTCSLEGLNC